MSASRTARSCGLLTAKIPSRGSSCSRVTRRSKRSGRSRSVIAPASASRFGATTRSASALPTAPARSPRTARFAKIDGLGQSAGTLGSPSIASTGRPPRRRRVGRSRDDERRLGGSLDDASTAWCRPRGDAVRAARRRPRRQRDVACARLARRRPLLARLDGGSRLEAHHVRAITFAADGSTSGAPDHDLRDGRECRPTGDRAERRGTRRRRLSVREGQRARGPRDADQLPAKTMKRTASSSRSSRRSRQRRRASSSSATRRRRTASSIKAATRGSTRTSIKFTTSRSNRRPGRTRRSNREARS